MVPAFTSVSEILSPTAPQPTIEPITPFGSTWKFPTSRLADHSADTEHMNSSAEADGTGLLGQQHRSLSDSAIAPMSMSSENHDQIMADFLLNPEGQSMSDEPLDLGFGFGNWDLSSSSFNPDLPLPPTAHQTPSAGHMATGSISDSEHHSTDTGEGSVNTPILDALGLGDLTQETSYGSGDGQGEGSGTSMDFKW